MSQRLGEASRLAEELHRGQVRKGTAIPYISHLYAVAALVLEWGGDEDAAIAAFLHDAVEDCGGTPVAALIRERFGDRVADTVLACSDSLDEDPNAKASWIDRKEAHIAKAANLTADAALVTVADKVHNLRALVVDLERDGVETLDRFRQPDRLFWYYESIAEAVGANAPTRAVQELRTCLKAFSSVL